jgi:hypothetical protein
MEPDGYFTVSRTLSLPFTPVVGMCLEWGEDLFTIQSVTWDAIGDKFMLEGILEYTPCKYEEAMDTIEGLWEDGWKFEIATSEFFESKHADKAELERFMKTCPAG